MTPADLKGELADLCWSQARLARLCGLHDNTVGQWTSGKAPIPRWVPLLLDLAKMVRGLQERLTG